MQPKPIVYVKRGCPWCQDALAFFKRNNLDVDVQDVLANRQAMQRMLEISGQRLTPTFEFGEFVVADFSVDEFIHELKKHPNVQKDLGLMGLKD